MGMTKILERLLRIRDLEEQDRRAVFEKALAQLHLLQSARQAAWQMEKQGRARVAESVRSGDISDRQAGLVETSTARAKLRSIAADVYAAEQECLERREEFLQKRVERQQAETLRDEAAHRELQEAERRSQMGIDDWFGTRTHQRPAKDK